MHWCSVLNTGPVGIKNIAVAVGEEAGTLEEVYEPFLIQEGYMIRTRQGRVATEKTIKLMESNNIQVNKSTDYQPHLL